MEAQRELIPSPSTEPRRRGREAPGAARVRLRVPGRGGMGTPGGALRVLRRQRFVEFLKHAEWTPRWFVNSSVCPGRLLLVPCEADAGFLKKHHVKYLTTAYFKSIERSVGSASSRPSVSPLNDDDVLFPVGFLHGNTAPWCLRVVGVHGGRGSRCSSPGVAGAQTGWARGDGAAGAVSVERFSFFVVFVNTLASSF